MQILKKFISLFTTIILVSLITFFVFQILPGNPAQIILGADADPLLVENLELEMGLDKPILIRYLGWIKGVVQGDLGTSLRFGGPVLGHIKDRLEVTTGLVLLTVGFTILIGLPIGLFLAYKSNKTSGTFFSIISQLGLAIPTFWVGILLMFFFSVKLKFFPAGGYTYRAEDLLQSFKSLILPALSLSIGNSAMIIRYLRNSVVDEMNMDYVRTAYIKGLSRRTIIWRHILRNALLPVVTILGMIIIDTLGGSIIIETVFSLPGLGSLISASITSRDFPLIQGLVLYLSTIVVFVNFIVDFAYTLLDPRIRRS